MAFSRTFKNNVMINMLRYDSKAISNLMAALELDTISYSMASDNTRQILLEILENHQKSSYISLCCAKFCMQQGFANLANSILNSGTDDVKMLVIDILL